MKDSFNAVFIEADAAGELMFYGRGAGGMPTASAVLGDLIDAAQNLVAGSQGATMGDGAAASRSGPSTKWRRSSTSWPRWPTGPASWPPSPRRSATRRVDQIDAAARDPGRSDDARLIFVTHKAKERDFEATMAAVRQLEPVHRVGSVLRVIGEDE